jgi:hypothetical protein
VVAVGALGTALHALFEELGFRVGLVGTLKQRFPATLAVFVPGAVFALAHLGNKGANWIATVNIVLIGGALGFLYLASPVARTTAIAWVAGWHFGWNDGLTRLGIPVSGHVRPGALTAFDPLPTFWSGGPFGLEASPATTLVFAAMLAYATARYRRAAAVRPS